MSCQAVIAIDGPAGAGKSTVAKALAKALGCLYIDTGAMYRAITLAALRRGVSLTDVAALTAVAGNITITFGYSDEGSGPEGLNRVFLDGEDVTWLIRTPQIDNHVSQVSSIPGVREEMVRQQRLLASTGGVVMDGRDVGTTVLPTADWKFFLTASLSERTQRRFDELVKKGYRPDIAVLADEIQRRDWFDSQRDCSPLVQAADAVVIDTSEKSVELVVGEIMAICCRG